MSELPPDSPSELPPSEVTEPPPTDIPELPPVTEPEPEPEPPQPKRPSFRAGKAFATFALTIAGQFFTGIAVIVIAMLVAAATGAPFADSKFIEGLMKRWEVPLIVATVLVTALMTWVATRIWAWDLFRDRTEAGLGLRRTSSRWTLVGAGTGVAVAFCYFAIATWFVPFDPKTPLGPMAQFVASGVLARIVFTVIALTYAPLVEEFLFRGLLFKGFSASWGVVGGGAMVTILFVLLHLFETINYWPATLAIVTLAIAALIVRIRSGSLVPPVALHFAYNAVVVVGAFAS
ncbi:MAG TPA: CPBP family glutamic-type intramembrane protease [Thermoanaerobaculia bacterium]|nr:CPBP family glutamic-type intramembrane protease [Thermoanaerobaculia bacterium]